jgi:hypothetical protein
VEDALRQFLWYAFQTAIVVWIMWVDYQSPDPKPGIALALGIGWALALTVLLHLIGGGIRRLAILIFPPRIEQRHPIAVEHRRSVVPLHFLRREPRR